MSSISGIFPGNLWALEVNFQAMTREKYFQYISSLEGRIYFFQFSQKT
jgi:hypothetical protein